MDKNSIPTGKFLNVKNSSQKNKKSPFDFREFTKIGDGIFEKEE